MAKPNSGFLADNDRYSKPSDPDLTGYIITQCPCCNEETYYWLASYEKKRDGKWIQTLACRPRENDVDVRARRPKYERG